MLTIKITGYDEFTDSFRCVAAENFPGLNDQSVNLIDLTIPGTLMPYIAPKLVESVEEIPFGLIDGQFTLTSFFDGALSKNCDEK